ncbi:SymE family type I addiction module toxin [bacterium AH-315-E07]|nr:SymE family type I addiction module toxin [bacterium AH-315-E07]
MLKRKWLAQAGFQTGQLVIVRALQSCLVLNKKI